MRGRFVVGYHNSDNDYDVGDTGGAESVTLTTAQMPQHSHGVTDSGHTHNYTYPAIVTNNGQDPTGGNKRLVESSNTTSNNTGSSTTGISIQNAGSSNSHENRPPYYALCYIMKT